MLQVVLQNADAKPFIQAKLDFITKIENEQVYFNLPLLYRTRHWEKEKIGTVTYIYPSELNHLRAKRFNQKNIELAKMFDREPTPLTFYLYLNRLNFKLFD